MEKWNSWAAGFFKPLLAAVVAVCVSFCLGEIQAEASVGMEKEEETGELNYILGRPMTEQEIQEQKSFEPRELVLTDTAQEEGVPSVEAGANTNMRRKIPESYDSREWGHITSVKNQNPFGSCWTFSVMACAESSLISQNLEKLNEVDLSERHLAYFCYHPQNDPLGNTQGDSVLLDHSVNYMSVGGNSYSAAAALSNWMGAADESTAPYGSDESLEEDLAYEDAAHLKNAYFISAMDTQEIKQMIMEHGAVTASIRYENIFFNYDTASYYGKYKGTNHGVAVIGWDDHYSVENFKKECRPDSDGAWLVKNSWGESWGDGGYFWLSYEDAAINEDSALFTVFEMDRADNYDHNYHYDGSVGTVMLRSLEDFSLAEIYQVDASNTGAEELQAVGVAVLGADVDYSIQVYRGVVDVKNPESGTPMFAVPQEGTIRYSGYHTIPLQNPVSLGKGSTFSVVIRLKKGTNEKIGCFMDNTYQSGKIHFITNEKTGQSLIKIGSREWIDTAAEQNPWTPRMKAFTSDIQPILVDSVAIDSKTVTLNWNDTVKLPVSLSPADTTQTSLTFRSSDPSVATVDTSGKVTAVGKGKCKITVVAENGAKAICSITVRAKKTAKPLSSIVSKGKNLCEKAKVYSCSGSYAQEQAAYLIDGNPNTKWCARSIDASDRTYLENGAQHAVVIDLGKTCRFNTYTLLHAGVREAKAYNTNTWELLVSEDAQNWISADYQEGNTSDQTSFEIGERKARYVMLKIWNADNYKTGIVRLYEMMLFEEKPLKAPSVSSVANTAKGIQVKWNKISSASGYYVYRKPAVGSWKKIDTVKKGSTTNFTDKSVKNSNGTVYFYTVKAYKDNFVSGYDKTGKKIIRLTAPGFSNPVCKKSGTMTVKWKRNQKADSYQIQYALNNKFKKAVTIKVKSGKIDSRTIQKLQKKKTYYIRIRSCKKSGKTYDTSAWSAVQKIKMK